MEKKNSPRIIWIDVAKGIGIIFVILGHCVNIESWYHRFIFTFHMPLFFLLSGIVLDVKFSHSFIWTKIRSLIVPYVLFSLFGLVITLLIPQWRNSLTIKGIIADIYLGNPDYINISSIWFLMCLFIVVCMITLIHSINNSLIEKIIIIICGIMGFVYGALYNAGFEMLLPGNRLPCNLDVALVAIAFTAIGFYYKKIILVHVNYLYTKTGRNIIVIALMLLIVIAVSQLNGRVNLHGLLYNNWFLYIIGSLCGVELILGISAFIQRWHRNVAIIWLGKNSLILLGAQAVFVRLFLLIYNARYGENVMLYRLNGASAVVCFISVFVSSIIFAVLLEKIKRIKK